MQPWRKNKMLRYLYLPFLLAALLLAGCTLSPAQLSALAATPAAAQATGETNPLANTAWQLVSLGTSESETPVVAGSTVTLEFDDAGMAGGNAGCNTYGGDYTVDGDTIEFGALFSTMMACVDEGVMAQEQQFLAALDGVDHFAVDGDQLALWADDGSSRLTFSAAEPTATPDNEPEGEVAVTLERGACFGTCPMYKVTIYTDGTVVFEGENYVDAMGRHTTTIEPQVVEELVAGFEEAGYFEWDDEYTHMTVSDLPTIITSVTRDGETKQITHYAGDPNVPVALPYLETWIDLAAYTSQWTGVESSLLSVATMDVPVMTLERTACFGMCPVYGVSIFEDGTVVYIGVRHVAETGVRVGSADPGEVEFWAMQLAQYGYFDWEDEYMWMVVTDQPYAITTLNWEDQYKTITRYDGDPLAPVGLVRFENTIDRLANVSQWVGEAQ